MSSGHDVGREMASVLTAPEAEMYVEALKVIPIKKIGQPAWLRQHEMLEKLNMQAHVNAMLNQDDFIKEAFISFDKANVLIYELVVMEVWREKVKPLLEDMGYAKSSTMTPYIVQYHEATVVNLLEALTYSRDFVEAAADNIVDVIDYCNRALQYLNSRTEEEIEEERRLENLPAKDFADMSSPEQLRYQTRDLRFQIAVRAVSILRYITDHITCLPLSATTRILNTHDMPCALVELAVHPPWVREVDGRVEKLQENQKWEPIAPSERLQLSKYEAQVWLALYNLLMEPECRRKYQFNTYNKNQILRLRAFLNDVILDQIPPLTELRRSLEELSIMQPPAAEANVVIEQMPELREHVLGTGKGGWRPVAEHQMKKVFNDNEDTMRRQAQALAATYNVDTLDALFPEAPKCAVCGEPATKRCSKCKNEWYCRRQCQVEHWPKHKKLCATIASGAKTPAS
ncbi:hypothetical protein PTSG_11593 [Salpingoeca rosetta]|uniref:Zinc finger MYND domain-containing protein 10 n=1 Tax=Salpingoeca rosetta (strain ATCC 50818 / BSB-021) TaxID=946362 RepID=F2TWM5_SALR5|nr:uncharacterized protein PTSG_11593 [Salpingoeca rosetta]EGD72471.1 hypothetical protein PTSG_11593 [Salpingoeca rosetta]|eukprot:XP_004999040.1 hypothetical protein PTSG_11593 [Salpingoeca rosetta]